jgi:hypothetical protein
MGALTDSRAELTVTPAASSSAQTTVAWNLGLQATGNREALKELVEQGQETPVTQILGWGGGDQPRVTPINDPL